MRKIFTLMLLLAWMPLVAWGQNEITGYWTDENVREEVTSENGVYKIETPGQLGWIAWKINEGGGLGSNYEVALLNDIDLSGHYWVPISGFYRNFKGNNHTIRNIAISAKNDNTDMGFFENIEDCSVSDLTLENVTVNPEKRKSRRFGAFAAYLASGNMKNCHVKTATIHVYSNNETYVGGLLGICQGDVDNCSVEEATILIEECENTGFYSVYAGGLLGQIYMGSRFDVSAIRNSSATGTIKGEGTWTEEALYSFTFGGIVGQFYAYSNNAKNNTIENCQSSFKVEANTIPMQSGMHHTQIIGGFCGSIKGYGRPFIEISNCVYNGEIVVPEDDVDSKIGYLFGETEETVETTTIVENCFYPSGQTPVGSDGTYSSEGIKEISEDTMNELNQWVEDNSTEEGEFRTWNTDGNGNIVLAGEEPQPEEGTDYTWNGDICTLLTPKGLLWFADQVNNSHETFSGKTVTLATGDWDMTSANWTPIGSEDESAYFSGTFDGNNQTVKIKGSAGGFFGYVKEGTVRNLTVDGTLSNVNSAGVVIDLINNGIVENVTAKGEITNEPTAPGNYMGGVIGEANNSKITDCTNNVELTLYQRITSDGMHGGIVGVGCDDQISGCVNNGSINSTADWVGGIIGLMNIRDNDATSVISECINNGSVTGNSKVGGIIGSTAGYDNNVTSGEVIIINSINNGEIKATSYIGGIVGFADESRDYFMNDVKICNSIINCVNSGFVTGNFYVSGIGTVQAQEGMETQIECCINQGEVTGSGTPTAIFAVYSKTDGTVTIKNSYYQAQSGLEATLGDQDSGNLIIENLQEIPGGEEWLADLNEAISAYNTEYPNGPMALYWVFDKDGKLTFGIPAPTIEGDTPFEESTEIAINVLAGTTVYYTTDGSDPATTTSTSYSDPITITETTTIKAIAVMDEYESPISEMVFKKAPAVPVISTESTTFDESITVEITAEEDAEIYYTTDGSDPTTSSELYTGALIFTETTTLKAIAVVGGIPSEVITVVLTKNEPEPEDPVIPDYPDYYNIYVDECEGVTIETSTNVVREGNSMTFTIEVADGYTAENMVVKLKRSLFGYTEIIKPDKEGVYEVKNIYTEIYIAVEGVELKEVPTGMEEITGVKVYTQEGSIYVQTPKLEQVTIISITGAIVENETQLGLKRYDLPRGIYIICVGEEQKKIRN